MSAKGDATIGLQAVVVASRDQVIEAATHALGILRGRAETSSNSGQMTVVVLASKWRGRRSPTIAIRLQPLGDGAIGVSVGMERWMTIQSRYAGIIPAGRKRIVGKQLYLFYLRALEQEFAYMNRGRGTVQRLGPW
jgi:hypothetical protein